MTTFQIKLPASLPFEVLRPGITLGPDSFLEDSAVSRLLGLQKRLQDYAESLQSNPHLSPDGRIAKWTEEAAGPVLVELNSELKALMGMELALLQRGEAIVTQQLARMPQLGDGERVALVEAFRGADREVKRRAMAAATGGKDPMLARAISETHQLLSGLEDFEMEALRAGMLDHLPEAPNVARERAEIAGRVVAVRGVIQMAERLRQSVISQADRSKLPSDALPRRGDMTREQATLYMVDYGYEAYKQLMD